MEKVFTLPNILSLLRLLMIPLIVLLMVNVNDELFPYLLSIYIITVFLDFLDGFIARKFSQESELGKIIDPLADKFLVLSISITLTVEIRFSHMAGRFHYLEGYFDLVGQRVAVQGQAHRQALPGGGQVHFRFAEPADFCFYH